jgi:predicted nucleic acid-binding protein
MKAAPRIIVDADVIAAHLNGLRRPSVLRQALGKVFCYTTVIQAAEVFSLARSARERRAVLDALAPIKVLGVNARSAVLLGELMGVRGVRDPGVALIAALSIESRLPILTGRPGRFARIRGVRCISPRSVATLKTGRSIFRSAARG